jgi:subtilisin family serine protease
MTDIDLRLATAPQLAVLLHLTAEEAERVGRAGPFANLQSLRATLPAHRRDVALAERVAKPDVNAATREMLVDGLALAPEVADKVLAARPLYSIFDLARIPGLPRDVVPLLASAFRSPRLAWRDKDRDREVAVARNPAKMVVVEPTEAEGADSDRVGLRAMTGGSGASYRLREVPQAEDAGAALRRVGAEPAVSRVIPAMRDAAGNDVFIDPVYVVVQFVGNLSPAVQDQLLRDAGLAVERRHRADGLVTARVPGSEEDPARSFAAIDRLNRLDEVEFAEPAFIGLDDLEDGLGVGAGGGDAERAGPGNAVVLAWNLAATRAGGAWAITRGEPEVVIAVIDSGIDVDHPAFSACLLPRGEADWNFESLGERAPSDHLGHGTFVAALVAGHEPAYGELGLAPGCKILPLKIPLNGNVAAYADRRAAILYAIDQVSEGQRLVINLSWKTAGDPTSIRTAIQAAAARGAIIVASAGNWPQYEDQPHYPSDYPDVISVGATARDGARAPYSFYGRGVDIAAPGGNGSGSPVEDLVSAAVGGGYRPDFGTSFAAPQVAAAAALLLSRDRTLGGSEVRRLLYESASPQPGAGLGAGLLDVSAALTALKARSDGEPERPAPDPAPQPSPAASSAAGLRAVNALTLAELTSRYGMPRLTARLIESRRPVAHLDELRTVLGMTPEVFARIAATQTTPPEPASTADHGTPVNQPSADPAGGGPSDEVIDANTAPLGRLLQIGGMLPFTARLIVARRPHASRAALMRVLGITSAVAARLSV